MADGSSSAENSHSIYSLRLWVLWAQLRAATERKNIMAKYLDRELLDSLHAALETTADVSDYYAINCWDVSLANFPVYKDVGDYYFIKALSGSFNRVTAIMLILAAEDELSDYPMEAIGEYDEEL